METINIGGIQYKRDLALEKRIKRECKYFNSERHPSERCNFKQYCDINYSYLMVKNNKVYTFL